MEGQGRVSHISPDVFHFSLMVKMSGLYDMKIFCRQSSWGCRENPSLKRVILSIISPPNFDYLMLVFYFFFLQTCLINYFSLFLTFQNCQKINWKTAKKDKKLPQD